MELLYLDIESSPNLGFAWDHYETTMIKHVEPWTVLCMGYAWGDGPVKITAADTQTEAEMMKEIRDLLDRADLVVAHNGDRFDLKKMNARMLYHRIQPPSPYKSVDTLKVVRSQFKFNQNGLDPLSRFLGIGQKAKHNGFDLWESCMAGDPKAWRLMKRYCKQDIVLLRDLYHLVRPWAKTHPNVAVGLACPRCGSTYVQRRGQRRAGLMTYQQFVCNDCGSWSRSRLAEPTERPELV